jgi:hypothetical protein
LVESRGGNGDPLDGALPRAQRRKRSWLLTIVNTIANLLCNLVAHRVQVVAF